MLEKKISLMFEFFRGCFFVSLLFDKTHSWDIFLISNLDKLKPIAKGFSYG